jgi:hypothetical protein
MVICQGESEFEVSIRATDDGEWEGRIVEYNTSRLLPVLHLCHSWSTREAAIAGLTRRWQRLYPDEAVPNLRDAVIQTLVSTDSCSSRRP